MGNQQASKFSIGAAITLLAMVGSTGLYVGALASDVENLEQAYAQQQTDHDSIVRMEQQIQQLAEDSEEAKEADKVMLEILRGLEQKANGDD